MSLLRWKVKYSNCMYSICVWYFVNATKDRKKAGCIDLWRIIEKGKGTLFWLHCKFFVFCVHFDIPSCYYLIALKFVDPPRLQPRLFRPPVYFEVESTWLGSRRCLFFNNRCIMSPRPVRYVVRFNNLSCILDQRWRHWY